MLDIEYKGANSVVLTTKNATLVVDPKVSVAGGKDVVIKEAIELATEDRFALNSETAKLRIEGPGEYGVANFDIKGFAAQRHLDTELDPKKSTLYRIEVNGFRVGVIGNVYEKLNDDQLEGLGILDILVIPVGGGGYTLDPVGAATIVRQIEPKVVIPVHYADSGLKYEVPQIELDEFIKQIGAGAPVEETSKYKLKQASAVPEGLTIVKLERS